MEAIFIRDSQPRTYAPLKGWQLYSGKYLYSSKQIWFNKLDKVIHIYMSVNIVIIGAGDVLSTDRRQSIVCTSDGLLSIERLSIMEFEYKTTICLQ